MTQVNDYQQRKAEILKQLFALQQEIAEWNDAPKATFAANEAKRIQRTIQTLGGR